MKKKILFVALAAVAITLQSCASHCGNKSYRTKRYVQTQTDISATEKPNTRADS